MAASPVQSLLGAVRRRLWHAQFVAAVRLGLWGSAGLMLLAVAAHLVVRPVPVLAVMLALAVWWASMMARATWRRPTHADCALWADRHLGGASAFTTLLDLGPATQATANPLAVQRLEDWATTKVPHSLRLLAESRGSLRLTRPLLSMLVCLALATVVLTVADPVRSSRQAAAVSSAPASADRPSPVADALASGALVSEVASALRSTGSPDARERRGAGRAPAAGPGTTEDRGTGLPAPAGATPSDPRVAAGASSPGLPADAAPAAATASTSGGGSGREAGDSVDNRADVGASRALRGTIPVQRSSAMGHGPSTELQADMDRPANYGEDRSMPGAASLRGDPVPAAATPPAAIESTPLTPTETSYVQAWMKASARRR